MSHFPVLVIGCNVEEQLAPFDERLDMDEEYCVGAVEKDELKRFKEFYLTVDDKMEMPENEVEINKITYAERGLEGLYDKCGGDWNGNCWRKENGIWKEYSRYNTASKWDWYVIGGRWRGYFKLKDEAKKRGNFFYQIGEPGVFNNELLYDADVCSKGDVDFEGMKREAELKAKKTYEKVAKIYGGKIPKFKTWNDYITAYKDKLDKGEMQTDDIGKLYRRQKALKIRNEYCEKQRDNKSPLVWLDLDDFAVPKEEYIRLQRESAVPTFAIVKDGKWISKGEMGYWGMSYDKMSEDKWNKYFFEIIDSLPDEEILTLVDCHI